MQKQAPSVRLLGLSLGQRYTHRCSCKGGLLDNLCDPETLAWETKGWRASPPILALNLRLRGLKFASSPSLAMSEGAHSQGCSSEPGFRKENETGKVSRQRGEREGQWEQRPGPGARGPRGPPGRTPRARRVCLRAGRPAANPGGRPGRGGACKLRLRESSFFAHTRIQRAIRPSGILFPFFFFSPSSCVRFPIF